METGKTDQSWEGGHCKFLCGDVPLGLVRPLPYARPRSPAFVQAILDKTPKIPTQSFWVSIPSLDQTVRTTDKFPDE